MAGRQKGLSPALHSGPCWPRHLGNILGTSKASGLSLFEQCRRGREEDKGAGTQNEGVVGVVFIDPELNKATGK